MFFELRLLAILQKKAQTRTKNVFKMNKEVGMLLQKRANTSGVYMNK